MPTLCELCRVLGLLVLAFLGSGFAFGQQESNKTRKGTGQRYAILIGVDDYNELEDLRFCGADQVAFRDELLKAGFPDDQIFLLHTKATNSKYTPFKANIEKQLDLILNLVERDDLLVFGFSGHGAHLDGKSYLLPAEANVENLDSLISRDLVYQKLQDCRASLKVAFIDACRDDPRPAGRRSARTASDPRALAQSLERVPEGLLLFTSCAPGELSMEEKRFGHGVFMHFILEGMQGPADTDGNRNVSFKELFKYAGQKTKIYVAREFNSYQTPRKNSAEEDAEVEDFALVKLDSKPSPSIPLSPRDLPSIPREPVNRGDMKSGEVVTNSIGMKLVSIPSGSFTMGSPANEAGRSNDETSIAVTISRPFYLGVTEVTQGQWTSVMGTTPWKGKGYVQEGSNYPATYVSWDDAVAFCKKLSDKEGKNYRLPTEAEWEYACRGGSTTAYSFGSDANQLSEFGWWGGLIGDGNAKAEKYAHLVGQKRANGFGLYDMHGNVWEWCSDWYGNNLAGGRDPQGVNSGTYRVFRGGGWDGAAVDCRSAGRGWDAPDIRDGSVGFRVSLQSVR